MISKIIQVILDAFIPVSEEARLCRALSEDDLIHLLAPHTHPAYPWILTLFPYQNQSVRAFIRGIKYRSEKALLIALGRIIADEILETVAEKKLLHGWSDVRLVPIPSSKKRKRVRGYNQTERIAEAVLPYLDGSVSYAPQALQRIDRPSQVAVSRSERLQNSTNAFFVPKSSTVTGACIILIDDVVETGATLCDARRALLSSGARKVIALAVAH